MNIKDEQLVTSLENRIDFYRRCAAWTFILGLLAGVCVFCGETTFFLREMSDSPPTVLKTLFCFLIATTGIAAGFAYRRRIRFLKDCRDKVLMEFSERQFFPKPVREGIITETQVLFGILFVLSVVITCTHYPVPKLPVFLDSNLMRMIPIIGFVGLCWISFCPERKNPFIRIHTIEDFLEGQKMHMPLRPSLPKNFQTYTIKSADLPEGKASHGSMQT